MQKANYKNEIAKREFFSYLKNSEGFSGDSVSAFEKAILFWEDFNNSSDFTSFDEREATSFRDWLKTRKRKGSESNLSLSYCYDTLRRLRRFFDWLSKQPNYKSKINPNHVGFLNLSKKEARVATQTRTRKVPSLEEVLRVLEKIEGKTEVEKRDRALISFTLLTGARISAVTSLPMKSFDRERLTVDQNPAYDVKTKFSKRITTTLFPLPDPRPLAYFLEWYDYLYKERHLAPREPIFPATKLEKGEENVSFFSSGKVEPTFWSNAGPARKIFEKRFKQANVPYYHPHTLRHLIVSQFIKTRLTEEEKKAISQNLGHENVGTTFGSYGYGQIAEDRQIDIIKGIRFSSPETQAAMRSLSDEDLRRLASIVKEELNAH